MRMRAGARSSPLAAGPLAGTYSFPRTAHRFDCILII